jgi:subtilisin family serine protease
MANGVSVKSASALNNTAYTTMGGTSMAAPAVTGSIALLKKLLRPAKYHASTLKALVLHTADDEIGPKDGPDFETGWGRMNTKRAAEVIEAELNASSKLHVVDQMILDEGETLNFEVTTTSESEPLRATIAWTDPAPLSTPQPTVDPSTKMLLNDLNLRIIRNSNGAEYQPYKLDPSNPGSQTVQRGDNERDNVEQVYIPNPAPDETYTLRV